jgi:hypothetical protein
VEITVTLERNEYVEGYMWAYYLGVESRPVVIGLTLMLVLTLVGLRALSRVSPARLGFPFLIGPVLSVIMVAGLPLYSYWRARTTFGQRWWLHQPTRYTLSNQGIASQAVSYSGFRKWDRIWRVEESGRLFLIYLSRSQVVIIPKRSLGSQDQVRAFRELVAENCSRVTLLDS